MTAVTSPIARPATAIQSAARSRLVKKLDSRHAPIAVLEHELHETLAGCEPARTRAAPVGESVLRERRAHDESLERSRRHGHLLDADDRRGALHAEDRIVATRNDRGPARRRSGVWRQNRIEPVDQEIERRDEVATLCN